MLTKQDAEVQLAQLDFRLGKGQGAVKERAKLRDIIDNPGGRTPRKRVAKQKKAKSTPDEVEGKKPMESTPEEQAKSAAELDAKIAKMKRQR